MLATPFVTSAKLLHAVFFGLGFGTAVTDTGCQIMTRKVAGVGGGDGRAVPLIPAAPYFVLARRIFRRPPPWSVKMSLRTSRHTHTQILPS